MAREKSRAKKRKFHGNRFDKNAKKPRTSKTVESHVSINSKDDGAHVGQSTYNATVSASPRKIAFNKPPNSTKKCQISRNIVLLTWKSSLKFLSKWLVKNVVSHRP